MSITTNIAIRPGAGPDSMGGDPELSGYRVVEGPHGTAIYGQVPLGDLLGLQKVWEDKGYSIWDSGVACALRATIVATTTPEGSAAWRAEIEATAARRAGDDLELRWVLGWDTGLSALVIVACLAESAEAGDQAARRLRGDDGREVWRHPPGDPDDLGRCIRLLDSFYGWRERLPEVAEANPEWDPFVRQWVELETLYREELPSGKCRRTNARMKALAEEVLKVPETTVDLSGLAVTGEREGPYFDALDEVLGVMLDRHEELPERLYIVIPPEPGARVLLWSRNGDDSSVGRALRRVQERGDG